MNLPELLGGPFSHILDVGGNIGGFAAWAHVAWPQAQITSFEPVPYLADISRDIARGRWQVETVALSDHVGSETMSYCANQHTVSTLQTPGPARAREFGLQDDWRPLPVQLALLDDYHDRVAGAEALLVKVDVEGHELPVLTGGADVLSFTDTVLIEMQNDPEIFEGSAAVGLLDDLLREHGLGLAGVAAVQLNPRGSAVLQFDAVYRRKPGRTLRFG